jgi:hypothetical protein
VECLPSKLKVLSSTTSTAKKKKKRQGKIQQKIRNISYAKESQYKYTNKYLSRNPESQERMGIYSNH